MANKLYLFEDKAGLIHWVTWLGTSREDSLMNSPVLGKGTTLEYARSQFLKNLEDAINKDLIRVTVQFTDDLEHPMNAN